MAESIALNIDCMEYMRTLPDKAFDLAVVDPPYGDAMPERGSWNRFGQRFDRYKAAAQIPRGKQEPERPVEQVFTESITCRAITGRERDGQSRELARETEISQRTVERTGGTWAARYGKKIISWDVAPKQEYFEELFRISRNQVIWGGNYFPLPPTRCFLIWRKTNIPLEGFSMAPVEYAWTSFNQNAACFEYKSLRDDTSGKFHPTEKPIKLYSWILNQFAEPGMKILDTHLGSGSSRIAAYDAGLDFVGCEIDEIYFRLQEERFERHTAQMNLFIEEESDE